MNSTLLHCLFEFRRLKAGNILISIFFTKFASSKGCHTIWAEIIPLLLDAGNAAVRKTNVKWIKMKRTVIR